MKLAKQFSTLDTPSYLVNVYSEDLNGQPIELPDSDWIFAVPSLQVSDGYSSARSADDYAGNTSTTGTLGVGGAISGTVGSSGDIDWFQITLTAGHAYHFNLKGKDSGLGTLSDPYLELFDGAGNYIAFDDDSGAGRDSQMTFTAPSNGTYYLSAKAYASSGTGTYQLSASETALDNTFDIVIRYTGDARYQAVFEAAAQRWEHIITGDLPDAISLTYGAIDDLLIDASTSAIDGPGSILAQATPDAYRGASGASLPEHGLMWFDSADVEEMYNDGTLQSVIIHEMGHVLGIGTLWSGLNLLNGFDYTGSAALAEYRALTGNANQTGVPVEDVGGSGSIYSHWRESVFDAELMTSIVEPAGIFMPISRMTVGSLSDMGYMVNLAAADPYSIGGTAAPIGGITSNGFDPSYYLARNPDVQAAGVDPYQHFLNSGWSEGRDPSASFSTTGYRNANPDVKAAGANPLLHYDSSGWREGRDPSANFDTTYYLLHSPDVAAAQVNPLAHWLTSGIGEARLVLPAVGDSITAVDFDPDFYLTSFADVAAAGIDPYQHFLNWGWHEGRDPNGLFDTEYYLARNPDVAAAGVNPLLHYHESGWREGRDPSALFSTNEYRAANPDVAAAGVDPLNHFLLWGLNEGRLI